MNAQISDSAQVLLAENVFNRKRQLTLLEIHFLRTPTFYKLLNFVYAL